MAKAQWYEWGSYILLAVGGGNWGLSGLFGYNILTKFLSGAFLKLVYGLIGVSGIYAFFMMKKLYR